MSVDLIELLDKLGSISYLPNPSPQQQVLLLPLRGHPVFQELKQQLAGHELTRPPLTCRCGGDIHYTGFVSHEGEQAHCETCGKELWV